MQLIGSKYWTLLCSTVQGYNIWRMEIEEILTLMPLSTRHELEEQKHSQLVTS